MDAKVTPLKDCIKKFFGKYGNAAYETLTNGELEDVVRDADTKIIDGSLSIEEARAMAWFAHVELTNRGIPPTARECLGKVPTSPKKMFQIIRKADAPYIDLLWLGQHPPVTMPRTWSGIKHLANRPRKSGFSSPDEEAIYIDIVDVRDPIDEGFKAADKIINRKMNIAKKCMALRLKHYEQAAMRWLCSQTVRRKLHEMVIEELTLRKRIEAQGIKQVKAKQIEGRIMCWRAWKLAGGGCHWQEATRAYKFMTGKKISRQGMKDMIDRLATKKLVRRRRRRTVVAEPLVMV